MTLGALTSTLWTLVLQKRLHRFDIKNFFNHSRPPKHSPRSAVSPRQCCTLPIDTSSSGQGSRIVFCTAKERSKRRLCLGLARLCQRFRTPPPQHEMGTQWFFNPTENMLVIWLSKTSLFFSNASFFFDHSMVDFTKFHVSLCSILFLSELTHFAYLSKLQSSNLGSPRQMKATASPGYGLPNHPQIQECYPIFSKSS